jgi:hypothetical protein
VKHEPQHWTLVVGCHDPNRRIDVADMRSPVAAFAYRWYIRPQQNCEPAVAAKLMPSFSNSATCTSMMCGTVWTPQLRLSTTSAGSSGSL